MCPASLSDSLSVYSARQRNPLFIYLDVSTLEVESSNIYCFQFIFASSDTIFVYLVADFYPHDWRGFCSLICASCNSGEVSLKLIVRSVECLFFMIVRSTVV